jgi:hypothetical protein
MEKVRWIENQLKGFAKANKTTFTNVRSLKAFEKYHFFRPKNSPYITMWDNKKEVIIFNTKTGKSSKARCHETDTYNLQYGLAVAWARYKKETIPDFYLLTEARHLITGDEFLWEGLLLKRLMDNPVLKKTVIGVNVTNGALYNISFDEIVEKRG